MSNTHDRFFKVREIEHNTFFDYLLVIGFGVALLVMFAYAL